MSSVERAYRDPVHDFITLTDPMLIALIDTPEFQRLRRIRQLGASHGTYHGAEHSRFGHSLGVLRVMHKVIRSCPGRWPLSSTAPGAGPGLCVRSSQVSSTWTAWTICSATPFIPA